MQDRLKLALADKFNFPLNEKSKKLILANKQTLLTSNAVILATEGVPDEKASEKRAAII